MNKVFHLSLLQETRPYVAYAYAYPHKTAYRPIRPRRLREVWREERRDQLFLYIHIPFCEMRCGFCNLFTTANPNNNIVDAYLNALARQAAVVRDELGADLKIARMAIGGGTPSYLLPDQLARVLDIARRFGVEAGSIPISVETSPRTASRDRLSVLSQFGVERISMGVQSFVESEVTASGRAQREDWVERAIGLVRELRFPVLNLDLIYGLPGQTVESWIVSIEAALRHEPDELYLYPLYVRPLTGLERRGAEPSDSLRLACYRAGRNLLIAAGYKQISMRMFRKIRSSHKTYQTHYCCQDDGMIGLGCGARSYTRDLHYSCEYAVGSTGVQEIIRDYIDRSDESFSLVDYGCELDTHEQRRRWLIKSLFHSSGLDVNRYIGLFGAHPADQFSEVQQMIDAAYLIERDDFIQPTASGLEWSDALAPMLFSDAVEVRSSEYQFH